jgi:hypothetical protein
MTNVGEGFKPSRPPIPLGGLIMWLPLSLTTHDHDHDKNGRERKGTKGERKGTTNDRELG